MIQVQNLTKRFGPTTAIEDVTFDVKKGEILGFLGPNGAGKTTTMRVLAGFFPASNGKASIAGFDVFEKPLEVKRRVGYLPEHPPVYTEMSVDSYLRFVAVVKGVEKGRLRERLRETKKLCGLEDQGARLIRQLSKGFRQRVGLAQAIIHEPDVLILDEPTVGLDPKQIIEVRELIRSLRGDHTIILSTHILPEVSMTCERVIIINKGKIVAVDTPENLTSRLRAGARIELELGGAVEIIPERLSRIPGVLNVSAAAPLNGRHQVFVDTEENTDLRPEVARQVIQAGVELYHLRRQTMTLEEIYLQLTTTEEGS